MPADQAFLDNGGEVVIGSAPSQDASVGTRLKSMVAVMAAADDAASLKRVLKDRAKTGHGRRMQGKVTVGHECRMDDGRRVAYNASVVEREERKKSRRRGECRLTTPTNSTTSPNYNPHSQHDPTPSPIILLPHAHSQHPQALKCRQRGNFITKIVRPSWALVAAAAAPTT